MLRDAEVGPGALLGAERGIEVVEDPLVRPALTQNAPGGSSCGYAQTVGTTIETTETTTGETVTLTDGATTGTETATGMLEETESEIEMVGIIATGTATRGSTTASHLRGAMGTETEAPRATAMPLAVQTARTTTRRAVRLAPTTEDRLR